MLEIVVPDELVSNFSTWHHVLNYWYLPSSQEDFETFDKEMKQKLTENNVKYVDRKLLKDHNYHDKIKKSWDLIFDLDFYFLFVNEPKEQSAIQATLWEIKIEWVRKITFFTGR
ncbi:DUF3841 domain-containing protein [Paenibacillus antri]|uniref:DUF3841 domain-containing protein n=1 Tax=Paenibacillus antri TaxID=2582848 RepID=A0A5R9G7K1_9BACL|nr:DUF3841 domain-containing protein [Paenibacillus antri]